MVAASRTGHSTGFRRDIEGLRGLAILLVVAYHAHVPGFTGGYVGVDVFFVLSGYLITGLLASEIQATGRVDLPGFYARRIRRLLPAAITVVLATLLLGYLVYPPADHGWLARSALATSLYVSNLFFARAATDYLADAASNPLLHTWSLAVEEQFYLFWPVLVLLGLGGARAVMRRGRLLATMAVVAGLSCGLCIWLTGKSQPWAFFILPARAWEFAAGALARMIPERWPRQLPSARTVAWVGLAAILAATVGFDRQTVFPGWAAMLPVIGTALTLAAGAAGEAGGPFRLLLNPPMQTFGRLSYSWYLWHWPVLIIGRSFEPLTGGRASIMLSAVSLGLAAITWRLIESPVRRNAGLQRSSMRSLALGGGLTLVGVVSAVGMGWLGDRQAREPAQRMYLAARALPRVYADGCHLDPPDTIIPACIYGDTAAPSAVVLFGDSHAAQWFPALEGAARSRHLRLISLTKSACPAPRVTLTNQQLGRNYAECTVWRDAALERIRQLHPVAVVVASSSQYIALPGEVDRYSIGEESWRDGLDRTVRALDSAGVRTLLLTDTPFPGLNVLDCLARAAWNPLLHRGHCEFPRLSRNAQIALRVDRQVAAAVPSAHVVDLTDSICSTAVCRPESGGIVIYRDEHHLTTRFAATLAGALAAQLPPSPPEHHPRTERHGSEYHPAPESGNIQPVAGGPVAPSLGLKRP